MDNLTKQAIENIAKTRFDRANFNARPEMFSLIVNNGVDDMYEDIPLLRMKEGITTDDVLSVAKETIEIFKQNECHVIEGFIRPSGYMTPGTRLLGVITWHIG